MTDPKPLRLLAEEAEDLKIIAAAVQDVQLLALFLREEPVEAARRAAVR